MLRTALCAAPLVLSVAGVYTPDEPVILGSANTLHS